LQDLRNEVKTLKVTTDDVTVSAAAPTQRGKLLPHPHHPPLSYLQVNKQDSGFTEKSKLNASSSSSDDDASDELYSLLSLIQYKVESLGRRSTSSSQLKSSGGGTESVIELGTLDDQLGNSSFDFSKFKKINKHVIRAVLQCHDKVELKRQLLFTYARVKVREVFTFERDFFK
jgi:hypothetical protein